MLERKNDKFQNRYFLSKIAFCYVFCRIFAYTITQETSICVLKTLHNDYKHFENILESFPTCFLMRKYTAAHKNPTIMFFLLKWVILLGTRVLNALRTAFVRVVVASLYSAGQLECHIQG